MSSLNIRRIIVGVICLAVYGLTWLVMEDSLIVPYIIAYPVAPISYRLLIGKVEGKEGVYFSIANSVLVCVFLLVIIFDLGGEPGGAVTAAAIWFEANRWVLKSTPATFATPAASTTQDNAMEQPEQKEQDKGDRN